VVPCHPQWGHGAAYHQKNRPVFEKLWDKAEKSSECEVLHILDLFRPLGSDIMDDAEHHTTRSNDSYPEKGHYIMLRICLTSSMPY